MVVACVGIGESEKLGMSFAQIFPKRQLLKILLSRTETGRELCALSSAHIVPLPAGHPFLGHSPTFPQLNQCVRLPSCARPYGSRPVEALLYKQARSLTVSFCDPQFADC